MFRTLYAITALLIAMCFMGYHFDNIELKVIAALLLLLWMINVQGIIKGVNRINALRLQREQSSNTIQPFV